MSIDLGLGERTEFLGHVSDDELQRAYATASLFVMPAVQGYGLPALEALDRRIPTIVHRDSGVSEILSGTPWVEIIEGQNGQLESAIKSMLERLLNEQLSTVSLPKIPSSMEWAESIARACGWLA
jgi:glycosyltransferase involved in cell wall biosynthesis